MPIHLHAEPGDYAPIVLLPGDPQRSSYIAATFLDQPRLVNDHRGLLGYSGTWQGQPVSVQTTGMGGPSTAIVVEELVMLGARSLVRVGTCGALAPGVGLGDLVCAVAAVPGDRTTYAYTQGEPHAPTADFSLVHAAVHEAKHRGLDLRVGLIATSDTFYDPDPDRNRRWSQRGVLAVEMEAAVLFTVGALRGIATGCLLAVSDLILSEKRRIDPEPLREAVDRLILLALASSVSAAKKQS